MKSLGLLVLSIGFLSLPAMADVQIRCKSTVGVKANNSWTFAPLKLGAVFAGSTQTHLQTDVSYEQDEQKRIITFTVPDGTEMLANFVSADGNIRVLYRLEMYPGHQIASLKTKLNGVWMSSGNPSGAYATLSFGTDPDLPDANYITCFEMPPSAGASK